MKIQARPKQRVSVDGYVHSVESLGTVDGPGVRYVIFTQGCPLRCQYCHNPDSFKMKEGTLMSSVDLLAQIHQVADFLKRANGGVTISGGEPLVQTEFVGAVLRGCKEMGLHTAVDTTGYLGARASDELLKDIDLVLLDIKSFDPKIYRDVTKAELEPTLEFAKRLEAMNKPMWIRFVLVPGLTDGQENVEALADFVSQLKMVERVEVAPFHKMGEFKWKELGLPYKLSATEAPSPDEVARVRQIFADRGLVVV